MDSERATYRITYGGTSGPRFEVAGDKAPSRVADCSETGVRFVRPKNEARVLSEGERIEGMLHFSSGERVRVSGRVIRLEQSQVAIHLDGAPIPHAAIIREQMHLRRHHKLQKATALPDPKARRRKA